MTPLEILDQMQRILGNDGEHWHKGGATNDEETAFCLLRAHGMATGLYNLESLNQGEKDLETRRSAVGLELTLTRVAEELFPEFAADRGLRLAEFNDHELTGWDSHIRVVIEKTRAYYEEQVS